jgi:hypothetical protein
LRHLASQRLHDPRTQISREQEKGTENIRVKITAKHYKFVICSLNKLSYLCMCNPLLWFKCLYFSKFVCWMYMDSWWYEKVKPSFPGRASLPTLGTPTPPNYVCFN